MDLTQEREDKLTLSLLRSKPCDIMNKELCVSYVKGHTRRLKFTFDQKTSPPKEEMQPSPGICDEGGCPTLYRWLVSSITRESYLFGVPRRTGTFCEVCSKRNSCFVRHKVRVPWATFMREKRTHTHTSYKLTNGGNWRTRVSRKTRSIRRQWTCIPVGACRRSRRTTARSMSHVSSLAWHATRHHELAVHFVHKSSAVAVAAAVARLFLLLLQQTRERFTSDVNVVPPRWRTVSIISFR